MPIKDLIKRREYQKELMRKRRNNGLTENVSPVSPVLLDPNINVSPSVSPLMLDPVVSPNSLDSPKSLDPVRPKSETILQPLPPCQICPNMNAKYDTNKTYCLNCDLKTNQQEIVPLGLVQQLQEQLKAVATLPAAYIDN